MVCVSMCFSLSSILFFVVVGIMAVVVNSFHKLRIISFSWSLLPHGPTNTQKHTEADCDFFCVSLIRFISYKLQSENSKHRAFCTINYIIYEINCKAADILFNCCLFSMHSPYTLYTYTPIAGVLFSTQLNNIRDDIK